MSLGRLTVTLAAAAAVGAVLVPASPHAQVPGGTVVGVSVGDFDSLDPGIAYTTTSAELITALHRALYIASLDGSEIRPDLADGPAAISADARTVTVTLRAGVRFSPPVGRDVRSEDVKYAIERGFTAAVPSGYANVYFASLEGVRPFVARKATGISGIQTPDQRTLVFKLSEPVGGFFAGALSMGLTAPVPREYAQPFDAVKGGKQSSYGVNQVSTGPYMIERDAAGKVVGYRKRRYLRLVRNPNWDAATDARPALADRIEIDTSFTTSGRAAKATLAGTNTFGFGLFPPGKTVTRLAAAKSAQLALANVPGFTHIALNTTIGPLRKVNVRRAVAAALDRRALLELDGGAVAGRIATHFLPPGFPGHTEAGGTAAIVPFLAKPRGDLGLARRYMRKAGYRDGRYHGTVTLTTITTTDPEDRASDRIIARAFAALGLRLRFRVVRPDQGFVLCATPKERIAVCGNGWFADFPDAQTMLQPSFHGKAIIPRNNPNFALFNDPTVNAAIESARRVVGADARAKAWARVDRLVTARVPYVPLAWPKNALLKGTKVTGQINQLFGEWDLESIASSE